MTPVELDEVVQRLRLQGTDDALYEAKACSKGLSKDIWETVSAFGNTRGGTLLLGIEESNNFHLAAGFDANKVLDQFIEGIGSGGKTGHKVENPPRFSIDRIDFEGGQILAIELAEVDDKVKPCFVIARGIAGGAFKRIDDKDIRLSASEVYELQHLLEVSLADREGVEQASLSDLDSEAVEALIASEKAKSSKALRGTASREDACRRLGVLNCEGQVTLAGLLSLGVYPQQFFPKLVIDVTAHPGTDKSSPGGPRFLDRVLCEGTIGELVDDGVRAVVKNLRTFSYVEGSGRRDELEIPVEVIREALANAVVHREYDNVFLGQSVSVDIFADRVEVLNPGGLWGGKTLETLADGQSRCRNDALMKLVSRIHIPNIGSAAEGQGSGISLMINGMRSRALEAPQFDAGIDYFKVVLWRSGAELSDNREWLKSMADAPISRTQEILLLEIRREGFCTIEKLHAQLGYDSDEIRKNLRELVARGLLAESPRDTFSLEMSGKTEGNLSTRDVILQVLQDSGDEVAIREIAARSGKKMATLRAHMNQLVADGLVEPTASLTSRNRKYRLKDKGIQGQ